MENLVCETITTKASHQAKKERKNGFVPGNLYGKGIENVSFRVPFIKLENLIEKHGEHGMIDVELEGKLHKALLKELQREPVSHKIIHIDLEEVSDDSIVQVNVPLKFTGESMINSLGGIIQKEKDSVRVRCKAGDILNSITVDISKMQVGDTVKNKDLTVPEGVVIEGDPESLILVIDYASKEEDTTTTTTTTEEAAPAEDAAKAENKDQEKANA